MCRDRQDLRQHQRPPLVVRPGEPKRRVKLATDPLATARLATTSARLGVPVDVAAWLALELVPRGAPDAGTLWDAAAGLSHRPDRQDQALRGWLDQLRRGTSFFEDELPYVWMPVRVICE